MGSSPPPALTVAPRREDPNRHLIEDRLADCYTQVRGGSLRGACHDHRLLINMHRAMFQGIEGHAGRCRGPGSGSERLEFGGHRSLHRDEVRGALEQIDKFVEREIRRLDGLGASADFSREALRFAAKVHADLIIVHPFEDGNGRSSRLFVDSLLVRLGMRPIPWETTRNDYILAMHEYVSAELTRRGTGCVDVLAALMEDCVGAEIERELAAKTPKTKKRGRPTKRRTAAKLR